jgi:hypothetical protein
MLHYMSVCVCICTHACVCGNSQPAPSFQWKIYVVKAQYMCDLEALPCQNWKHMGVGPQNFISRFLSDEDSDKSLLHFWSIHFSTLTMINGNSEAV